MNDKKYDLEDRCRKYAEKVIDLMKRLPKNSVNNRMIDQEIGSSGSMGANYCEAVEAESRKDFEHKVGICKKESKESRHWLRLLSYANPEFSIEFRPLLQESQELILIFSKIIQTTRANNINNKEKLKFK